MRMVIALIVVGAVVLAVAIFVWLNTPGSRTTKQLLELGVSEEDSQFIAVGDIDTHYLEAGEGPVLLLIHGTPSHTYTWRRMFDDLCENFRVIAFDLKGNGLTDSPDADYTMESLTDFTVEFMDALGLGQATIAGHSSGGEIAWRLALRDPERVKRLVLISPSGYPRDDLPFTESLLRVPLLGRIAAGMTPRWLVRMGLEDALYEEADVTEGLVERYYQCLRKKGNRAAMRKNACEEPDDRYQRIAEIRVPCLVVWGEHDRSVPTSHADLFDRDLPEVRVEILPQCGHMPQWEKPDEVLRLMADFLSEPPE